MRRDSKCCELKRNVPRILYQFMSITRKIHKGCKAVLYEIIKNMSKLALVVISFLSNLRIKKDDISARSYFLDSKLGAAKFSRNESEKGIFILRPTMADVTKALG